jgi:hypothetical protein
MILSQLIEEKSNKIIEVLAAAVPIEAIFLGKLFAMLATSIIGIAVWVVGGAAAIALLTRAGRGHCRPRRSGGRCSWRCRHLFRDELSADRVGVPEHRRAGVMSGASSAFMPITL